MFNGDITITYSFADVYEADTATERYDRIQISLLTLPFIKKFKTDAKENDVAMQEAILIASCMISSVTIMFHHQFSRTLMAFPVS